MKLLHINLPRLSLLLWCCTIILAPNILFDLNETPEESLVEASQPASHESIAGSSSNPIPVENSELSSRKRKLDEGQPVNSNASGKRAYLFHAVDVLSSNRIGQDGPAIPDSIVVNNWVARSAMIRIITAMNDKAADQLIRDALNLIQPLGHVETNLTRRPKLANDLRRLYVIKSGQVVEAILRGYCDDFRERIHSKNLKAKTQAVSSKHESLPFGLAMRFDQKPGKVFRVLSARSGLKKTQTFWDLISLYKTLAISLYEEHNNILKRLRIPPFGMRMMQTNILHWLMGEIFSPADGHPVIGTLEPDKYPNWFANIFPGTVGDTQAKLIRYFSQAPEEANADEIVSHLLDSYLFQTKSHYLSLSAFAKSIQQDPAEAERKLQFRREVEISSKITEKAEIAALKKVKMTVNHEDRELFDYFLEDFNARLPEAKLNRVETRRYHPDLPLAMYFDKKAPLGFHSLRILKAQADETKNESSAMLDSAETNKRFQKLARAVDYTHKKILMKLEIIQPDYNHKREEALAALIDAIVKPKLGLPIISDIQANNNIPPWEDIFYASSTLFGDTQLKLLTFFSEHPDIADTKGTSDFFLTGWYQDNHPGDFKELKKALKDLD
ncbi:hypothetical protein PGTUg99_033766 [Puccinia graminis f. sp. tritici]|uniref:Secreted protein n=1 Tax=Puccinia graminis f. sp. tritici TaxID=56615 RepID=A0A5B0SQQ4_PUCGR|nr:hypothetical protein PGTUg99_033766 [Puccinia graminis f. sp. tritici]